MKNLMKVKKSYQSFADKVLKKAQSEYEVIKKVDSSGERTEIFEELFGLPNYRIELDYFELEFDRTRVLKRLITRVINKTKKVKEIKEFIKKLKVEELKLSLLSNNCYTTIENCNEIKGMSGVNIENYDIKLQDILVEFKDDKNILEEYDFISDDLVIESVNNVITTVRNYGVYDLVQQGLLNLDDYVYLTLKDLELWERPYYFEGILTEVLVDFDAADVEVYEYDCTLFSCGGRIITTMDEEDLKELIWDNKMEKQRF